MMSKNLRKWIYGWLAVVLSLSVLALSRPISAQPLQQASTDNVEIVGVIQKVDAGTLTINGLTIDVRRAQLNVRVSVGLAVKVEGTLSGTGNNIVAREINAAETGIKPGEVEIVGIVQSMNGQQITVNGQVIDLSGAEIKAGVTVGKTVKVHLTVNTSGVWAAREVEVVLPGSPNDDVGDDNSVTDNARVGEVEITGTLEQAGSDFIVVSGQRISITGAEVKGRLVAGVLVKVHFRVVNGQRVAREVENALGNGRSGKSGQIKATSTRTSNGSSGRGSSQNSGSGRSDDRNDDDHGGNSGRGGSGNSNDNKNDDHGGNSGSGGSGGGDDD
jgi:hypothetical protein